jgi:heme/copper-type cytochrome/quinol oxidase subunit 3
MLPSRLNMQNLPPAGDLGAVVWLPTLLAAFGASCLTALIAYALTHGPFLPEANALFALPWGKVTLTDLYLGFALFSAWVVFREKRIGRSLAFVVLTLTLGNAFTCAYVAIALYRSRGDWTRFWMGERSPIR